MKQLNTKQTRWNLSPLFKTDNDPIIEKQRKIIKQKNYKFINKWKNKDDYLESPAILKQALDEYEELQKNYGDTGCEGYYFELKTMQDQNDPRLKAKYNKISDFGKKIINDIRFFELKIAKIPQENQNKFLEYNDLKDYKHFLEKLFAEAKYLLSEKEENILTLKRVSSYDNWVKMVSAFLSKEERKVILKNGKKNVKSFAEIISLLSSQNKRTRDSAAKVFNEVLEKHSDVAEAEINSILDNKKVDDELRKMPRPDLGRHISDDISSEIVDSLIDSVSSRFYIPRKYYELKTKLMNVKKLKYHERNVPYGKTNKEYSYRETIDLIFNVFNKLDKKFADILCSFIGSGQIDVYPKKNKRDGAYCIRNLITQPTYILLNYTDKLNDVLTIAHEIGHGINNELMKEKQNALNFGTPVSTVEVASTFMEDFVLEEILKEADDELRLAIMMNKLNDDVSTIFRQIACYQFEQELHKSFREKGYLSKKDIGKLFQKRMSDYMGDFVEQSPGSENWWVYWGHIRRFFYNYSYASGLLISKSLQNFVKKDLEFVDKVKEFLSVGSSDSPKNIFKKLGINISDKNFWDKGLNESEKLLKETEQLAKKLGKI